MCIKLLRAVEMQGLSSNYYNSYYFFDGIRSLALLKGHEEIKSFAKQMNDGDFIDAYERMEDTVEISFENRPHIQM
jgi:hypothetical protein